MIKIGDFSILAQVSVKTLRHYDGLGLLRPVHVSSDSGYRYYAAEQLPRLYRILALRDLGFSLEQIGTALQGTVSAEQLRGMLALRRAEQQERVEEERNRLQRLESRLTLIENKDNMTQYDVVIKDVPAQWIASVREVIPSYTSVGRLYPEVYSGLGPAAIGGLPVAIWHDQEHKDSDVDAEAGLYVKAAVPASGRVQVYELPATMVATVIHSGAFNSLSSAYNAALHWVESNGYRIVGPIRELYLKIGQPVRQDDESYITELQVPVEKSN